MRNLNEEQKAIDLKNQQGFILTMRNLNEEQKKLDESHAKVLY